MGTSIVSDTIPLVRDDDGVLRVGGTRVPIDAVVAAFHGGATPEEILQQYPSLDLADTYAVLGYYLRHQAEVEDYLQRRQEHAGEVRRTNEERSPSSGVRARLLARRQSLDERRA